MLLLRHNRFMVSRLGKICVATVMLLCFCIMMQMLGVPVTLLNPGAAADSLAESISEGFSVPSVLPHLTPSVDIVSVADTSPSVHTPFLASTLFHPPPVL